jgi:CheY-like chemotaxis protein
MYNFLILDDDPADAIILREALLEIDPGLSIDAVDHADAALWRITSDRNPRLLSQEVPDLVVVGIQRRDSDGCQFVRHMASQPLPGAPPMLVMNAAPCTESERATCVGGAFCRRTKPTQYAQYKSLLRQAISHLRPQSPRSGDQNRPRPLCV